MMCEYHGPVNLGNPSEYTIKQLADLIIELTGSGSEVIYQALPTDDPKRRRPDITLARKLTGWEPVVAVEDGLARTVEWFKGFLEEEKVV